MQTGNGLGFISKDLRDLYRPLKSDLAGKDAWELKPPFKIKTYKEEPGETKTAYCPAGVLCIKVRFLDASMQITDVVKGEYMKYAVVMALVKAITKLTQAPLEPEDVLFCMDEVKILDVQMPSMGATVWQFCDFRFDYKLNVPKAEGQQIFYMCQSMLVLFESEFCRELEVQFRDIYHITVLQLMNKQCSIVDGVRLGQQRAFFEAAQQDNVAEASNLLGSGVEVDGVVREKSYPVDLLKEEFRFLFVTLQRTALLAAAEEGSLEVMQVLLDAKANVNSKDTAGFHALYLAAGCKSADKAVAMLLAAGASINAKNKIGYTALHNACGCGQLGAITKLLEARADLNVRSNQGAAAVHVAVLNDKPESLEVLAKADANMDMPAFGGNTPVHEAVMKNNVPIIQKLLVLKADINIESGPEHGYATPLRMAIDRKKKKAMKMLQAAGAIEKVTDREQSDGDGAAARAVAVR